MVYLLLPSSSQQVYAHVVRNPAIAFSICTQLMYIYSSIRCMPIMFPRKIQYTVWGFPGKSGNFLMDRHEFLKVEPLRLKILCRMIELALHWGHYTKVTTKWTGRSLHNVFAVIFALIDLISVHKWVVSRNRSTNKRTFISRQTVVYV